MPSKLHQRHSQENANRALRRLRAAAGGDPASHRSTTRPVAISEPFVEYEAEDIGRRATTVPNRPFTAKVPFRHIPRDVHEEQVDDPENIIGPVFREQIPVVTSNHHSDMHSRLSAFNKRCNFKQDGPEDDIDDELFEKTKSLILALPRAFDPWYENDEDRQRWLNKFDAPKRARMEEAWRNMSDATLRDIRNKTLMVKVESLLKRDDPDWAPRVIYVGSDAHNAITGPCMMVCMERLCKVLDPEFTGKLRDHEFMFAYKATDVQLMEFLHQDDSLRYYAEGDYSRNDREQRSRVPQLVALLMDVLGINEEAQKLLLDSRKKFEVYDPVAGIKAVIENQLPTGDTSTTFNNSSYNWMITVICLMVLGIPRARGIILGDDLLMKTSVPVPLELWRETVAKFKMVLKPQAPQESGLATFLSRRIVNTGNVPCLVPKIGKVLARFNVRASNNTAISDDQYMAGKSLAHAYEFRHAPLARDFFIKRFRMHYERLATKDMDTIEYDSWFLKISNLKTPDQVLQAIYREPVQVTDSEWREFVIDTYDIPWNDLEELMEEMVLSDQYKIVDTPLLEQLAMDF